jgi:hypothetical protein
MNELEKKFDLPPLPTEVAKPPVKAHTSSPAVNESQVDKDFDTARQNILNVIERSNEAIELQNEIFKDKEDARSAEALNALLKTVLDSADKLLDIHKKRKDIMKVDAAIEEEKGNTYIQNAVFTGSAKELQQLINNLKQGNKEGS